jgi:GDPmannose 4,6-dehydratase
MIKGMVAVVSGVTGQTGSYLAEILLNKGYFVIGFSRRVSVDTSERIKHLLGNPNFLFEEGDICDPFYITQLLSRYPVAEFYNLAAQSHVGTSFKQPVVTSDINYGGVLNILNCIESGSPDTKFYQASTSELFGSNYDVASVAGSSEISESVNYTEGSDVLLKYQDEDTALKPQSPYAIAKLAGHHTVRLYRESYDIFACAGILFNHESPRRGEKFVTRKITKWIGEFVRWRNRIDSQLIDVSSDENDVLKISPEELGGDGRVTDTFPRLRLGNLDAYRDWGHAKDYAMAMWMMLQHDKADDYVVSTEETHSIREFLDEAFGHIGIWDWSDYVVIDPEFFRPAEVDYLCGKSTKVRTVLGWKPEYSFKSLVKEMVEAEIK